MAQDTKKKKIRRQTFMCKISKIYTNQITAAEIIKTNKRKIPN